MIAESEVNLNAVQYTVYVDSGPGELAEITWDLVNNGANLQDAMLVNCTDTENLLNFTAINDDIVHQVLQAHNKRWFQAPIQPGPQILDIANFYDFLGLIRQRHKGQVLVPAHGPVTGSLRSTIVPIHNFSRATVTIGFKTAFEAKQAQEILREFRAYSPDKFDWNIRQIWGNDVSGEFIDLASKSLNISDPDEIIPLLSFKLRRGSYAMGDSNLEEFFSDIVSLTEDLDKYPRTFALRTINIGGCGGKETPNVIPHHQIDIVPAFGDNHATLDEWIEILQTISIRRCEWFVDIGPEGSPIIEVKELIQVCNTHTIGRGINEIVFAVCILSLRGFSIDAIHVIPQNNEIAPTINYTLRGDATTWPKAVQP